jgi:hypothetical protein
MLGFALAQNRRSTKTPTVLGSNTLGLVREPAPSLSHCEPAQGIATNIARLPAFRGRDDQQQ